MTQDNLWWIPALPLLGSLLIAMLGPRVLRDKSHWPCILGAIGACVLPLNPSMPDKERDEVVAAANPDFLVGPWQPHDVVAPIFHGRRTADTAGRHHPFELPVDIREEALDGRCRASRLLLLHFDQGGPVLEV